MLAVEDIAVVIPAFVGISNERASSSLVPSAIIMFLTQIIIYPGSEISGCPYGR